MAAHRDNAGMAPARKHSVRRRQFRRLCIPDVATGDTSSVLRIGRRRLGGVASGRGDVSILCARRSVRPRRRKYCVSPQFSRDSGLCEHHKRGPIEARHSEQRVPETGRNHRTKRAPRRGRHFRDGCARHRHRRNGRAVVARQFGKRPMRHVRGRVQPRGLLPGTACRGCRHVAEGRHEYRAQLVRLVIGAGAAVSLSVGPRRLGLADGAKDVPWRCFHGPGVCGEGWWRAQHHRGPRGRVCFRGLLDGLSPRERHRQSAVCLVVHRCRCKRRFSLPVGFNGGGFHAAERRRGGDASGTNPPFHVLAQQ